MKAVPKKLRKALRRLPACNDKRSHRFNIAKAFGRYERKDVAAPRYQWSNRW